jgi:hypothetical protein
MSRKGVWIAAGVAGLLAAGAMGTASAARAAGAPPVAAPHWHFVKKVKTNFSGDFTAVVPTGKTTAWAFDGIAAPGGETAWQRTGTTWKKVTFPGKSTEFVATAGATSPRNVWAFADDISGNSSRVLRWSGSKWAVVKTFGGAIAGATVLGSGDVWVFGQLSEPAVAPALGVWHYNGRAWTRIGKNISGGTALSGHDAWGYTSTSVTHWNGHKWTATSVKSLLPAVQRGGLNHPQVVGVLALSDSSVFAIGSGEAQDEGGPLVVLHFDGHKWSKLATGQFGFGPGGQFSYDGHGGLWLPMFGPAGGTSFLVHYAAGKLTKAAVPVNPATLTITSVARIPGTSEQLAGGFTHANANRGANVVAVLMQLS